VCKQDRSCLRSPPMALRVVRIFSARCSGCGSGFWLRCSLRSPRQRLSALAAKLDLGGVFEAATRALRLQRSAALAAELYAARVFEAAGWATHLRPPVRPPAR